MGANVNAQNVRHKSCLHHAFEKNNLAIARFLVSQGASTDHVDIHGLGALHWLRRCNRPANQMIEIEWNKKIGIPILDFMSALSIEDFSTDDEWGNTGLGMFAWSGAFGSFCRALQLGALAQMEESSRPGITVSLLYDSATGGSVEIIAIVLTDNPNTDINEQYYQGTTLLHAATRSSNMNIAMIEFLLVRGADANIQDDYGQTPLCYLMYQSLPPDIVEPVLNILVQHGGSLSVVDCLGNTLLHHATQYGRTERMIFLLEQGCKVNARNVNNLTPLHCADISLRFWDVNTVFGTFHFEPRRHGLKEVINLLFSWEADPLIIGRFPYQDLVLSLFRDRWVEASSSTKSSYVYLTPASLAGICPDKDFAAIFNASLHRYRPETYMDSEGDVYWEPPEHLDCSGEGSEMMVMDYRDEELGETELLNGIWNTKSFHLYDRDMLSRTKCTSH
ncbi:hypothetical protein MMC18_003769 [Xylographa bjoerkii]|nr:hypothetical protein [Xylographa bjoerkii]